MAFCWYHEKPMVLLLEKEKGLRGQKTEGFGKNRLHFYGIGVFTLLNFLFFSPHEPAEQLLFQRLYQKRDPTNTALGIRSIDSSATINKTGIVNEKDNNTSPITTVNKTGSVNEKEENKKDNNTTPIKKVNKTGSVNEKDSNAIPIQTVNKTGIVNEKDNNTIPIKKVNKTGSVNEKEESKKDNNTIPIKKVNKTGSVNEKDNNTSPIATVNRTGSVDEKEENKKDNNTIPIKKVNKTGSVNEKEEAGREVVVWCGEFDPYVLEGGRQQTVCQALLNNTTKIRQVSYKHKSCQDVRIGNRLSNIYMTYLLARAIGASFSYSCEKQTKMYQSTFMTLLQETAPFSSDFTPPVTLKEICSKCQDFLYPFHCDSPGLDLVAGEIQRDLQQVAFRMTNTTNRENLGKDEVMPPLSNVALHVRCGDVLSFAGPKMGLLPHSKYAELIGNRYNATDSFTVAIITQQPSSKDSRQQDNDFAETCQMIMEDLIQYLQQKFQNASISIPPSQSIAEDYRQLILADGMAICGLSTFCTWPVLASVSFPNIIASMLNPWLSQLAGGRNNNTRYSAPPRGVNFYSSNFLRPKGMPMDDILQWLRTK